MVHRSLPARSLSLTLSVKVGCGTDPNNGTAGWLGPYFANNLFRFNKFWGVTGTRRTRPNRPIEQGGSQGQNRVNYARGGRNQQRFRFRLLCLIRLRLVVGTICPGKRTVRSVYER
jgi:hypothetical protein